MEWLYGNLTSQYGSNLNLNNFDKYVTEILHLPRYIRYVDDIVIITDNKSKLINSIPFIIEKLKETNQTLNTKKTIVDTAYHGVPFLGKVSYPYGYQKPSKIVIKRTYNRAKNIRFKNVNQLLSKANAQIGTLKIYNCRCLIKHYAKNIKEKTNEFITFNEEGFKFEINK